MSNEDKIKALEEEVVKLRLALQDAANGLLLAHKAIEKGFYDEALLYTGVGNAKALQVSETIVLPL